jgi:hypothetical protein
VQNLQLTNSLDISEDEIEKDIDAGTTVTNELKTEKIDEEENKYLVNQQLLDIELKPTFIDIESDEDDF